MNGLGAVWGSGPNDVFAVGNNGTILHSTDDGASWQAQNSGTTVSAATNLSGDAVVFAVLTDNSLWETNPSFGGDGWVNLSPAGTILSASAATDEAGNANVFAITADSHL